MSCSDSTSPINIDIASSVGKCDMKCDLIFNYKTSSCVATNNTDYISLNYDESTIAPVIYNSIKYQVTKIKLYSPSLHTFGGEPAAAEIIVEHTSSQGTNPLFICVPLTKNNAATPASSKLNVIISNIASNAPSGGDTTTIPLDDFSLNTFIPYKPFFTYTGVSFTPPCQQNIDFVVFSPRDNIDINITSSDLTKLNELIGSPTFPIKTGASLFFNPKGPSNGQGDDIFIDCKPINKSESEDIISTDNPNSQPGTNSGIDVNSIVTSPIFQLLMGSLIFIMILYLAKMGINSVHTNFPTFSLMNNI